MADLLYGVGIGNKGQIGDGDTLNRNTPVLAGSNDTWETVYCGQETTIATRSDGTVWGCGNSDHSVLGFVPTVVGEWEEIVALRGKGISTIAIGNLSSFAITTSGELWVVGYNIAGELGLGHANEVTTWTRVGAGTDWADIRSFQYFSAALKTDGTIWGSGYSTFCGCSTDSYYFTQESTNATNWSKITVTPGSTLAINSSGELHVVGVNGHGCIGTGTSTDSYSALTKFGTETNWENVWSGDYTIFAQNSSGTLYGSGHNHSNQLGLIDGIDRYVLTELSLTAVSQIQASSFYTIARKDTVLYGTGRNGENQLLLPDARYYEFTQISSYYASGFVSRGANSNWDGTTHFFIGETPSFPSPPMSPAINFGGRLLVGDDSTGKLWEVSMDTYQDNGNDIERVRRFQIIHDNYNPIPHSSLIVDFENDSSDYVPVCTLKWSDDDGYTYSTGITLGANSKRAEFRKLGTSRSRIYELTTTVNSKISILGGYLNTK